MSLNGKANGDTLRGRAFAPDAIHGKSAYEIAVMNGFDGTEEEWLESLHADWDERADEAKADLDEYIETVMLPEAKAELEEAKDRTVEEAVAEIADAETNSLKILGQYTADSVNVLEKASVSADEKEVLIWENTVLDPDNIPYLDNFTSGVLSISDKIPSDVDRLRIVFVKRNHGFWVLPSITVKLGDCGCIDFAEGSDGGSTIACSRMFSVYENGNINFEGADPENGVCIPYRIYGVKNNDINIGKVFESYGASPIVKFASGESIAVHDSANRPLRYLKGTGGNVGKNILPFPYADGDKIINNLSFTNAGGKLFLYGKPKVSNSYSLGTIELEAGTYTLSREEFFTCDTFYIGWEISAPNISIADDDYRNALSFAFTLSEKSSVSISLNTFCEDDGVGVDGYIQVQLEDGESSTDWEAYASTLTVEVYGKNLLPYPYRDFATKGSNVVETNGITFTDNGDGTVTVNGTATAGASLSLAYWGDNTILKLPVGVPLTLSGTPSGGSSTTYRMLLKTRDTKERSTADDGLGKSVTLNYPRCYAYIWIPKGSTVNNIVFKPMLELGTVKTEYEKYKEKQTLTVSSEGVVPESLNTHYPNTSIINKNGTTMEIEYVVDTKNYIDEELSKLPIVKSVNGITPDENGNVSVDVGADVDSDSLPDYWNTYLTEKKSAILQERLNVGNHGDYFSYFTDYHDRAGSFYASAILKYLQDSCGIDKHLFGGDIASPGHGRNDEIPVISRFSQDFKPLNLILACGNHELDNFSMGEIYSLAFKHLENMPHAELHPNLYSCYDNVVQKIRYINLNTYRPADEKNGAGIGADTEQLTWLCTKLSELSEGWGVVVNMHNYYGWSSTTTGVHYASDGGKVVKGILNAFNTKTAYTSDTFTFDFSSANGYVIAIVSGHMHKDYSEYAESGFPIIETVCEACNGIDQMTTRNKGDISENAIDLFFIDTTAKTIKSIRIGAGEDRNWTF